MNNLLEFLDNNNFIGYFFNHFSNDGFFLAIFLLFGLAFFYMVLCGISYSLIENVIEKSDGFFKLSLDMISKILIFFYLIIFLVFFIVLPIIDYFYESKKEKAIN